MIAVDTNVLVLAHREDAPLHEAALRVVRQLAEGAAAWAIPRPCVHEFLAVATHPRIFDPPTPIRAALDQVVAWAESPRLMLLGEAPGHLERIATLLIAGRVTGPAVHDARIAAICLAHRVSELWTADRDFSRFPQLRTRNPLVG